MKLHLGCGKNLLPDYTNIDRTENADIVHDIRTLDFIDNDTVDEIYISHVMEHFSRREIYSVLCEYNRVLKTGATLRISVPDFDSIVSVYNGKNLEILTGLLYGGQVDEYDYHKICFNFDLLSELLRCCGFGLIQKYDTWEFSQSDDYSKAYIPHMDRNGTLMSLNVVCTKLSNTFITTPRVKLFTKSL